MSAVPVRTHAHGHRDTNTPAAIKKQEDLLYFTHPQGVNNSLEPGRGRGS